MQEPDPNIPPPVFPMPLSARVTVLGNYFINLFLIKGDSKTALFETGISGIIDTVIFQLEALGVIPDYLILSHPHSDHTTGLPGLMERFPKCQRSWQVKVPWNFSPIPRQAP
jgi:2-aminobenzoylacetyl-CoA thioesterase